MTKIRRDHTIDVPGIPAGLQSLARDDIGRLSDAIAAVADSQGMQFLLNRVCVTDCFEDEVNRLLSESSGLTAYVATRHNVQAIGKTIWIRSQQGGLGFEVIIDANQIGAWGLNNPRCLTTVLHELIHVLYEGRHLERLGEEEYTAGLNTRERWLSGWANLILDEFDVDRFVDALVVRLATKDDGRPWSLRELEEAQGVDWIQGLLDGLNKMPRVLEEKVWRFRTWQMGIDDLAEAVIPAIKDILILLSHTASMYMETELWPDILQRIKKTDASRRFLGEHLDTILGQLDDAQMPFEESVQIVTRAVEGIFQNCGLSLKTVPEGVYISVDAPSR
jgi:hypothetical protein